jgi:hypothetical protein
LVTLKYITCCAALKGFFFKLYTDWVGLGLDMLPVL